MSIASKISLERVPKKRYNNINQNFKRGENMLANLTTDEKDAIKILDYWFIMEFLNQQSLKKYKEKETSALTYKKQLLEGRKKRPNKKV